jgi:potassium-transporting ATPase potassium-binding subunit
VSIAGWLQALVIIAIVVALHVPLGDYLARAFTSPTHWRAERLLYRAFGVNPDREQNWKNYAVSLLAFSSVSIIALYLLFRFQGVLPLSLGHPGLPSPLAFQTAVSFTTNTSWQNYAGESTMGHLAVMAGLGVQAFGSAAVGMAAGLALIRGFTRNATTELGNFWVDLTRSVVRALLPPSIVFGLVLVALGVEQNLAGQQAVTTLAGGSQALPGGPVGSWEPIKLMGGDGGGFFNANSAHPYENPNAYSNAIEIILMLLIPTAFLRVFGRMVGSLRQGWTLLVVVGILFVAGTALTTWAQLAHPDTASMAAGAATEGTETRFGVPGSSLFGISATASADGAANSSYDSFSNLGGGMLLAAMMLGEISPGGTGSGLYGLLIAVLLAVFIGGLMVGRTPEYLRKRIGAREMKHVVGYALVAPTLILVFTAVAMAVPSARAAMGNAGPHGLTEILYAYTSNTNSNGSAFAGLSGDTTFYNTTMSIAMLLGRYLPILLILGLAGSLAAQSQGATTVGTLRAHGVNFVVLTTGAAVILALLNFLPALSLGPLAGGTG